MADQVSLEGAMQVLHDVYGEKLEGDHEGGKTAFAETLEERMQLPKPEARRVVDALIEAHTLRWQGRAVGVAGIEGSGQNPPGVAFVEGAWYL